MYGKGNQGGHLLDPLGQAGVASGADGVVTGREALRLAVRRDPQVLGGKLCPLPNHAVGVGEHEGVGGRHQLVCNRLACIPMITITSG